MVWTALALLGSDEAACCTAGQSVDFEKMLEGPEHAHQIPGHFACVLHGPLLR